MLERLTDQCYVANDQKHSFDTGQVQGWTGKKAASVGKSVVKKAVVQDFWTVLQLMSVACKPLTLNRSQF